MRNDCCLASVLYRMAVVVLFLTQGALCADTPDYDAVERYTKRLKNDRFVAIPIYSVVPHKGIVGSNNRHAYGTNLRALYPASTIVSTVSGSEVVTVKQKVQAGWQPFQSNVQTPPDWAMVNVGWSAIQIDDLDEKLRPGEYVYLRGERLAKGSVRDPERTRREPEDTRIAAAAEMLAEVHWYMATKNQTAALNVLQELARQYPTTPSGSRAKAMLEQKASSGSLASVGQIDNDVIPEMVFKKATDETDEERAEHLLTMAKFALQLKQHGKAQGILLGLVAHYPKTRYATTGYEWLRELTSTVDAKERGTIRPER